MRDKESVYDKDENGELSVCLKFLNSPAHTHTCTFNKALESGCYGNKKKTVKIIK